MHRIAVTIRQHLDLDMAGTPNQLFQIDLVVAKGTQRLATCALDRRFEIRLGFDHPHAASAPAPARLEHHRIPHHCSGLAGSLQVTGQRTGRGHHRHPGGFGQCTGGHLVPQPAHHFGLGANEADARIQAGLCKIRVLRQQAIAGMDRIDIRLAGNADDVRNVEIRPDRFPALTHQVGLIRLEAVQRQPVFAREDAHRADIHLRGGPEHADGNFGAVGNQNTVDGFHRFTSTLTGRLKQSAGVEW